MNEQIENLANRIAKYFQKHLLEGTVPNEKFFRDIKNSEISF